MKEGNPQSWLKQSLSCQATEKNQGAELSNEGSAVKSLVRLHLVIDGSIEPGFSL